MGMFSLRDKSLEQASSVAGATTLSERVRLALPDAGIWGSHDGLLSPGSLLWPVLYLQNVAMTLQGPAVTGVTTHYWSLAVEEHFYIIWPLLVWLGTRRQVVVLALGAALFSVLARGLLWLYGADLDAVVALTPLRMDGRTTAIAP